MGMRGHVGPPIMSRSREKRSRPVGVLLRRMFGYLRGFKRAVAIGAVLSVIGTLFSVFDTLVLSRGIDYVATVLARDLGIVAAAVFSAEVRVFFLIMLLYLGVKLGSWAFNSAFSWILASAQAGLVRTVQADVYDHLVKADLSYHKSQQSGNVTSRVTSDTANLSIGIQVLIQFAGQILLLVMTFLILWITSPIVALTSLVVVPGIAAIAALFGTVGQRIMLASQRAQGQVSGQIAENLSGIHVAKAFNREGELASTLLELNKKSYRYGFRFMMLMSAMQPLMNSVAMIGVSTVLFVAGSLAVGSLPLLSIGEVFLGITLVNRFMWPLLALVMMAAQVQASLASMDRISDVLDAKPGIRDEADAMPLKEDSDGITFENVVFSYAKPAADSSMRTMGGQGGMGPPMGHGGAGMIMAPSPQRKGGSPSPAPKDASAFMAQGSDTKTASTLHALNGVSFSVKPGHTVALVGHTGAGKSTIASLINRFYDPQEGRILIGDQDIRHVTLKSLHEAVSLIPQDPYLFEGTVFQNIHYGRPSATESEVQDICRAIGADEFIKALPLGYETPILESGKNLSAGQRQMITIARTMLANPRILVLDEATSRLDAYSESLVQDAQSRLFAKRTTVVIAHRLTTIVNASKIVVIDNGKIVEEGTHNELLGLGGMFKTVYDIYYAHQGIDEIKEEAVQAIAPHMPAGVGDGAP